MFFYYGATTRNGKGTLMESTLHVMGDYGLTVRPETIAAKPSANSQNPTEEYCTSCRSAVRQYLGAKAGTGAE